MRICCISFQDRQQIEWLASKWVFGLWTYGGMVNWNMSHISWMSSLFCELFIMHSCQTNGFLHCLWFENSNCIRDIWFESTHKCTSKSFLHPSFNLVTQLLKIFLIVTKITNLPNARKVLIKIFIFRWSKLHPKFFLKIESSYNSIIVMIHSLYLLPPLISLSFQVV